MLLNVAKYVLHICLVSVEMMVAVMILCIVIRAASVTMTGSWELHVHYRCLIRKVLGFAVVFGRPMVTVGSVRHEISVWKTIIMQIGVGEFLLVHLYFVEFGSHLAHLRVGMSSADLATEDVSSLGSCSLWSLASIQRVGPVMVSCPRVYFCDHLHLVGIAHNKLFLITSIWGSNSALSRTTRNDLTLGCYCWNFIVILIRHIWHVLLDWSQHWHVILLVVALVLHKIRTGGSSEFHLASTNLVVTTRWSCERSITVAIGTIFFSPVVMMQDSVGTHGHVVVRSSNNSTIKAVVLVHLETHSHLVVFIDELVWTLLVLGAKLLVHGESVIIIVVLGEGTACKIRLVHLHWMHTAASSRHHVHHWGSSTVIRCCSSITHSTDKILTLHNAHRSHLHSHIIHGHPIVKVEWHSLQWVNLLIYHVIDADLWFSTALLRSHW